MTHHFLISFTFRSFLSGELLLDGQWAIVTALVVMLLGTNKWNCRFVGTVGVSVLIVSFVQEINEPEHSCYSLLGGGGGHQLQNIYNYTTSIQHVETPTSGTFEDIALTWSITPLCGSNSTLAYRSSEPFAWLVGVWKEKDVGGDSGEQFITGKVRPTTMFQTTLSLMMPDVLSLSLHGMQRTLGTGMILYLFGCGWLPLLSGVMMGPIYLLGTTLPSSLQFCPSIVKTNTCTEEFFWGMWSWCCIVTSLQVFRGSKKNQIERTTISIFIILNIWIIIMEIFVLGSGLSLAQNPSQQMTQKDTDSAWTPTTDFNGLGRTSSDSMNLLLWASTNQQIWSLLTTGALLILSHVIYVYTWLSYRLSKNYLTNEHLCQSKMSYSGIHPFLITDDILAPSCCTRFTSKFLCLADNVIESVILSKSRPYLHEQTPFRLLLLLLSLVTIIWTITVVLIVLINF